MNIDLMRLVAIGFASTCGQADLRCYCKDPDVFLMRLINQYELDIPVAKSIIKLVIENKGFGFFEKDSIGWIW